MDHNCPFSCSPRHPNVAVKRQRLPLLFLRLRAILKSPLSSLPSAKVMSVLRPLQYPVGLTPNFAGKRCGFCTTFSGNCTIEYVVSEQSSSPRGLFCNIWRLSESIIYKEERTRKSSNLEVVDNENGSVEISRWRTIRGKTEKLLKEKALQLYL